MVSKFKFATINIVILITLIWIYIMFLYLSNIQTTYDPFYLSRLAILNSNINVFNQVFIYLPYSYSLNVALTTISGDKIINNGYIPLVQFIALFSLLAFGRSFYQKCENPYKSLSFIIPLSVFLVSFLISAMPYQEYWIGSALYPLFLWGFLRYTNKKSYQLSILLILIFITIHFFAVPMSVWVIEFVIMYFLLIYLSKYFGNHEIKSKNAISTTFVILLLVIWFFWNAKLYTGLVSNTLSLNTLITVFKNLIFSNANLPLSDFLYSNIVITNPLYLLNQRIFDVLTFAPIALVFLYEFLRRNIFFFMHSKMDIFVISLIFPSICQLLIWGASGTINTNYLFLIFPFISYYYILKYLSGEYKLSKFKFINFLKSHNKKIINLYLILLVLSTFGVVSHELSILTTSLPSEPVDELSQWYSTYIPNKSRLVTDYTTQSYFLYSLSNDHNYEVDPDTFTTQVYAYLIGQNQNSSDVKNLNYLMVNNMNLNKPIIQGFPAWVVMNPLSYYKDDINQNQNMDIIYDSNFIKIYKNVRYSINS